MLDKQRQQQQQQPQKYSLLSQVYQVVGGKHLTGIVHSLPHRSITEVIDLYHTK